ncbi:MAG: adenosine deaminase [Micrococcaceae bacterium]
MNLPATASVSSIDYTRIPKVSLHDHLDGGVRPATIIELAAEIGHVLPTTDAVALRKWFEDSANSGSLVRYLETFAHTTAVLQTKEGLLRVAAEAIEDYAKDGVLHAEIRYAPEQHTAEGLTLDEVVEAVQEGINYAISEAEKAGYDITARQLLCAMRQNDSAMEIAELAVKHRDKGVAGFDIAGPEKGFLPSLHKEGFDYLAEEFMPVTVHAGEADAIESIKEALSVGRALRLGHGVGIVEDITGMTGSEESVVSLGTMANWIRDRRIAVEMCPTSNLQTGAIAAYGTKISDHPFDLLYNLGFAVTINTDNRLMSGVTLSSEYEALAETFNYDISDLEQIALNAAEAAFLSYDDKLDLIVRVKKGYSYFLNA